MKCLLKYLYSHRLPQTHSRPDETQTASREAAGRPRCGFPHRAAAIQAARAGDLEPQGFRSPA